MVLECPAKWGWGAPAREQKRLDTLLAALEKLRHAGITMAMVAVAFHKQSLMPLAQRVLTMWEMTPDAPSAGTQMLEVPVPASGIHTRVLRTISSDLKNYRVVTMRPDRDYISLVRHFYFHSRFITFFPRSGLYLGCHLFTGDGCCQVRPAPGPGR